jgi:hypothetical protein
MFTRIYVGTLLTVLLLGAAVAADEVRGVLLQLDAAKQVVTIEGRGKGIRKMTLTFQVNKDTQVLLGRKSGRLTDLPAGKRVRVLYEVQNGQRVALQITAPGVAPAQPTLPVPQDANAIVGTLQRVALTDREIVVIGPGPKGGTEVETTLLVPEDAKITKDQKVVRLEDLTEGVQAVVIPEKKNGKLLARSIQVGAAPVDNRAAPGERRIEKLRRILKQIDSFLEMLDKSRN